MGIFTLLIIILAFIAGTIRRELSLTLTGAVFLAAWVYCLVMTLILALIHHRRARSVSVKLSPRNITAGEKTGLIVSGADRRFFRLPGILVRCRLLLKTADGRMVKHDFDPDVMRNEQLVVNKRGAYFSAYDEFAVFDALGFFRFAFRIPQAPDPRILASPQVAEEAPAVRRPSGGTEQRSELGFKRTDNLIEHRPYAPGDDPRRINWKLYGHGGELFVREGEREPPPHSNLIILIDTQADSALYSLKQARHGVDLLCENALAAALACTDSGMDVRIGYSGGNISPAQEGSLATLLALPAALPFSDSTTQKTQGANAELPSIPDDCGILILALSRINAEISALNRFLKKHQNTKQNLEILYLDEGLTGLQRAPLI
jgi:uncharacterized protein (DUF58 family)